MSSQGIFADHAARYAECGLVPFPVGGKSGKEPLVKNWQKFRPTTHERLVDRYPDANIGIVNDNKLVIVDVDERGLTHYAIDRFGDTPVKVSTSPDRTHLYYKSSGEKRIIGLDGLKIDVLGDGGYAVAPPSVKPSGDRYYFTEGSEYDLGNLPALKDKSILKCQGTGSNPHGTGFRNDELFTYCRVTARNSETEEDLLRMALERNNEFDLPLSENEVLGRVASAWRYKLAGTLVTPGGNEMLVNLDLFRLCSKPDAFTLAMYLLRNHGGRNSSFAVDQEKVTQNLGWGSNKRRVANAIAVLIDEGVIRFVGKGGYTGRAYQYILTIQ